MKFGDWLKLFLQEHNLKQSYICQKSGLHTNQLYYWIINRNLPSGYNLAILSTTLSSLSGKNRAQILEEMVVSILQSG